MRIALFKLFIPALEDFQRAAESVRLSRSGRATERGEEEEVGEEEQEVVMVVEKEKQAQEEQGEGG